MKLKTERETQKNDYAQIGILENNDLDINILEQLPTPVFLN